MGITPDIIRTEFIGLDAKIAKSTNPSLIKLKGRVLDETRNTFVLLHGGEEKTVVKNTSVFHFTLHDGTIVEIDGKLLVGRPEDRVKKQIRRLW